MMNHASSYKVIRLALGLRGPISKRASHDRARGMPLAKLVLLASVGKAEKTNRCLQIYQHNFREHGFQLEVTASP